MAAYFIPSGRSIDKRMRKDSTLVAMADREYHTKVMGRIVRGAGGITPDIHMERRRSSSLYRQLEGWRTLNSRFFRFARQYQVLHPDVSPDFVADERILAEFRAFVDEDGFEYVSDLEVRLEQLQKELSDEDSDAVDALETSLESVDSGIERIEEHHWEDNAELLTWKLIFDIHEKAFGIEQAYAYDVTVDPQVLRAREILHGEESYLAWFEHAAIGEVDSTIASATDTTAVEVEGLVLESAPEAEEDSTQTRHKRFLRR
jgi:hypothetical protein